MSFIVPFVHAAEPVIVYWPDGDGMGENNSFFGAAIDFDQDLMVVSAPGVGATYVFQYMSGEWQHAATLSSPSDGLWSTKVAVAVDDEAIAVGVPSAAVNGLSGAGFVYVFERGETVADWQEVARLTSDAPVTDAWFGAKVAFEEDRILVSNGRTSIDPAGYLFERDTSGAWTLTRKFAGEDGSGLVVDDAAIGDDRIAFVRGNAGAYLYERGPSGWVLSDMIPREQVHSVVLEDDVLVLGAPNENIGELPRNEGVAYVYEREGGQWREAARLHSPLESAYGYFGVRLDMQDGLLVVGEGHETGAVYAFRKNETGEWVPFAGRVHGSQHGIVHVPAISARTLAIGFSVYEASSLHLYDVAELFAEADAGDDSTDDGDSGDSGDGSDSADEAGGNADDGNGNDTAGDDETDTEAGNEDETGIGLDDSSAAASGDGNADGATAASASGDPVVVPADSAADETSRGGGGAAGWLMLLLGLLPLTRKARCHDG